MKTFHFHIGSERCGSTFVQSFFNTPDVKNALVRFSIEFDIDIYYRLGELSPITGFDEKSFRAVRDATIVRHKEAPHDSVFSTQELLFGLAHDKGAANRCEAMCDIIEYLTDGFETRLIIVLRRQDTFIESLYNQQLKHGETREFMAFVEDLPLDNYRWDGVVGVFAERFGPDNVTVVPFERQVLASADRANFIEAIFQALGLDMKVDISNLPIKNPSIPERALEIQRLANRLLSKDEAQSLAAHFMDNMPKQPGEKYRMFSDGARAELLQRFGQSNRRLFSTFLPSYAPDHYLGG